MRERKPYAAYALDMEGIYELFIEWPFDADNPTICSLARCEKIKQRAVVGSVEAWLHGNASSDAQLAMDFEYPLFRNVVRREGSSCRIRKLLPWAQHMKMNVPGPFRHREARLAGKFFWRIAVGNRRFS